MFGFLVRAWGVLGPEKLEARQGPSAQFRAASYCPLKGLRD